MKFYNKLVLIALGLTCFVNTQAQIGLKPLQSNPTIIAYLAHHPDYQWNDTKQHGKWGKPDTLDLPFFDDFTSTLMYPDSANWRDNDVYVNRDFGIHPPSYGVATFDYLNANGKPYTSIEKENLDYGDTLTSQFINLKTDGFGNDYTIGDSIYLSFYYQAKGLGDFITDNDSLKLLFKDNAGSWKHIWGVRGSGLTDFIQVMIPILESKYLHETFQLQFVNLTHRWGNNNHWHLDNVYIDKDRRDTIDYQLDNAIASKPSSLLKDYFSLPYDHFLADQSQAADSFYFEVSNLSNGDVQTEIRYQESQLGLFFARTNFEQNFVNTSARGYIERKIQGYDLSNFIDSHYPIVIRREYFLKGKSVNDIPLFQQNDVISVEHTFDRHYAYDDGTPESGFGFNDLKTGEGRIVLAFELIKADTLRAVDFMLTYNTQDVGRQRFVFQIYQDIAIDGGEDELLFEKAFVGNDIYDGIDNRGFYTLELDQPITLPAGRFYVGWSQERNFNLTVGFDKNNGYTRKTGANKNIYFNVGDGWLENNNPNLAGAPMIRPVVGGATPWPLSVDEMHKSIALQVFPNPTNGVVEVNTEFNDFQVINLAGVEMNVQKVGEKALDLSNLKTGVYFITLIDKQNSVLNAKVIKQ